MKFVELLQKAFGGKAADNRPVSAADFQHQLESILMHESAKLPATMEMIAAQSAKGGPRMMAVYNNYNLLDKTYAIDLGQVAPPIEVTAPADMPGVYETQTAEIRQKTLASITQSAAYQDLQAHFAVLAPGMKVHCDVELDGKPQRNMTRLCTPRAKVFLCLGKQGPAGMQLKQGVAQHAQPLVRQRH